MKITKIREVKTPTRGTECSAGLDFYVPKGFTARLTSGTDILVPSGIRAEVPHGYALIPVSYEGVEIVDEEELFNQATERGKGGFGSTNGDEL